MKKAAIGMVVVMSLTLGLTSPGESKTETYTECVRNIYLKSMGNNERLSAWVRVGSKPFAIDPKGIRLRNAKIMSFTQFGKLEPILAQLRAAAIAKVKVRFKYDSSSMWVKEFHVLFNQPCK